MIDPLQEFGFRESNYERPNQEWECGWASQGEPCHIGPDGSGICQAHRECMPYKEGDRYRCARPRNFGGDCKVGPNPDGGCSQRVVECQPVRTLRGRRKLFTYSAAALALGCCMLMFGGSWSHSFISPGELTLQHHSKVQTCADCHSAAGAAFTHWVGGAVAGQPESSDSQRCLVCHEILGTDAQWPHGLSAGQMKAIGGKRPAESAPAEPAVFSVLDAASSPLKSMGVLDPATQLACGVCHQEHRGHGFDLTQMSNVQCQVCHTGRFHSFGDGHPEFGGYPYGRRTRLQFDHVTHYQVHFQSFQRIKPGAVLPPALRDFGDAASPSAKSCQACHQPDSAGKTMPIRAFEHSCAACHGPEIEDDSLKGVPLLVLPKVDEAFLTSDGPPIGKWPKRDEPSGENLDDVPSTPLMELLQLGDADYVSAVETFEATDWSKVAEPKANVERRELMQRKLWSVKRLIHDLLTEGEAGVQRRLQHLERYLPSHGEAAKQRSKDQPEIAALAAALFNDPTFRRTLVEAQGAWFPELDAEVTNFNNNMPPPAVAAAGIAETGVEPASGWYLSAVDGTLRYRVTGHTDRLLRALLDLAGKVPHLLDEQAAQRTKPPAAAERIRNESAALFRTVGDPTATFRCLGCHTADRAEDGRVAVNWEGRHVSASAQSFTKFSHSPHVTLLVQRDEKNDCNYCHVPQTEIRFVHEAFTNFREGYTANPDPHSSLTSGFLPVEKSTCAECHTSQLAGDNCLKCHNYHIFE